MVETVEPPLTRTAHAVGKSANRVFQRAVALLANRVELALVELQEERDRVVHLAMLAAGVAVAGLLSGIGLGALLVYAMWDWSPLGALLVTNAIFVVAGAALFARLRNLAKDWRSFEATLDQLEKDRKMLTLDP